MQKWLSVQWDSSSSPLTSQPAAAFPLQSEVSLWVSRQLHLFSSPQHQSSPSLRRALVWLLWVMEQEGSLFVAWLKLFRNVFSISISLSLCWELLHTNRGLNMIYSVYLYVGVAFHWEFYKLLSTSLLQQSTDALWTRLSSGDIQCSWVHVLHHWPCSVKTIVHGRGYHSSWPCFQPATAI